MPGRGSLDGKRRSGAMRAPNDEDQDPRCDPGDSVVADPGACHAPLPLSVPVEGVR